MIVEQSLSLASAGRADDYLHLFETEGYPLLARLPGRLIGLFHTEVGALEQIVELWAFETAAERDARSTQLEADPAYGAYLARIAPLLTRRDVRLLTPAPFFRLPLQAATALPA